MNEARLLEVKHHILEDPRRLNMRDWVTLFKGRHPLSGMQPYPEWCLEIPPCGTVQCLGGIAVSLFSDDPRKEHGAWIHDHAQTEAMKLLDLTREQANELFFLSSWPDTFVRRYTDAEDDRDDVLKAQITAERIDQFIAQVRDEERDERRRDDE